MYVNGNNCFANISFSRTSLNNRLIITWSSNPWDILLAIFIAVAGYNAGKFGLDRFIMPIIGEKMARNKKKEVVQPVSKIT